MEVEKVKESLKIIHRMKKDLTELRRNWMLDYYDWHNADEEGKSVAIDTKDIIEIIEMR